MRSVVTGCLSLCAAVVIIWTIVNLTTNRSIALSSPFFNPIDTLAPTAPVQIVIYTTSARVDGRQTLFCRTLASYLIHGHRPIILGWGARSYSGLAKLQGVYTFSAQVPPSTVLAVVDGFDTLAQAGPQSFLSEYLALNASIIASAETNCWPFWQYHHGEYCGLYPPAPTPFRFLNAGFFIGTAEALRSALSLILFERKLRLYPSEMDRDDQAMLSLYYLNQHPPAIQLDYYGHLSLSMHSLNPEDFSFPPDGPVQYPPTHTTPLLLHFNGDKALYPQFEARMPHYHKDPRDLPLVVGRWINEEDQKMGFSFTFEKFSTICQ